MDSCKYKIVFCTPALYSAGGVERVVANKANYFSDVLGYHVTIILTEGNGRECFFPVSNEVNVINYELGFEELWHLPFWKEVITYLCKQRRYRKKLKADLLRIRPDFTITTLRREINFINRIKDGSIKIGELHVNRANYRSLEGGRLNIFQKVFSRVWTKCLLGHLKNLDRMVVLTDNALSDWPELINAVKIPDPLPFRIDVKSELSEKRIISIGRYAYDKGNDLLLQAWTLIEKQVPDWTLDIFGNGDRGPYQRLLEELGIDRQRCHLHGPTADVKKEYLNSSLFVLPSRFEGFGLVLIEAMACGVPVIAFDCENGPRSIITNGVSGFLIPPFDVKAMAEKILLLIRDDTLRKEMGIDAQKAASLYDIDTVGQQWKQLFEELKAQ